MKRIAPSERMEHKRVTELRTGRDPLGEAARHGARMILQRVMEWERENVLGCGRDELKKAHMAEGTIELPVPQGRITREPFASAWLAASGKRASRLLERAPLL